MLTKELEKYIVYPRVRSAPKGNFFELARKNIIKKGSGLGKNLSMDIDKILYGKR
ncbi:MAG: hypothetical protein AAB672_01280 [Patescibacteria group bacterium]